MNPKIFGNKSIKRTFYGGSETSTKSMEKELHLYKINSSLTSNNSIFVHNLQDETRNSSIQEIIWFILHNKNILRLEIYTYYW